MTWGRHYARQRRQDDRAADKRLRTTPLKQRLDFVLIGAAAVVVTGFILAWQFLFSVGERTGVFEPPVIREVRDERVLENIWREKGVKLVDGTMNRGEGKFYVSQTGGLIHGYDTATRLWKSEDPFREIGTGRTELTVLRAGCGMDPASDRAATCPDMSALWALTDRDGLLVKKAGAWREAISATQFSGRSGRAVDGGDLVAAAISDDQRWLLLGTRGEGIGLYDLLRGRWVPLGAGIQNNMPKGPAHDHIVFWQGQFWVGGGDGVVALSVAGDAAIQWRRIEGIEGHVRDMAADKRLFVLESRVCDNKEPGCVRLTRLDSATSTPTVLMDERNIFKSADLTRLQFAAQQGRMLFLAGTAGMFRYDTQTHSWTRPVEGRFVTALGGSGDGPFYAAFQSGELIEITGGLVSTKWSVPTTAIVQLFQDEAGTLYALSKAEGIYELAAGGTHKKLISPEATNLKPETFTKLVGRDDEVLLFGPLGGTLHSISKRTFKDLPRRKLPAWVLSDDVKLMTVKDRIFGFVPEGRRFRIFRADVNLWTSGSVNRYAEGAVWYTGPASRISPWGEDSLTFQDGTGVLWRVKATEAERLTGEPLRYGIHDRVNDAAIAGGYLWIATDDGLFQYDTARRRWKHDPLFAHSLGRLKRVAVLDGTTAEAKAKPNVMVLGQNGVLAESKTSGIAPRIGGGLGFSIPAARLSDVARDRIGRFYLAGDGRVNRYHPGLRRVDAQWRTGAGEVTVLGVADEKPIALAGGRLYFGNEPVDEEAGFVDQAFLQGLHTWTVRRSGTDASSGLYLKRQAHAGATPWCLMRNPSTGFPGAKLLDAREIRPGVAAVLTSAGLAFYDRAARSWYRGPKMTVAPGTRLANLGTHLATISDTAAGKLLQVAPLSAMIVPDSCASELVAVSWETHQAAHLAVDEARGRAVWIDAEGAVHEWHGGGHRTLLDATGAAPVPDTLRRVFERGDRVLFTAPAAVWRYDRIRRVWGKTPVVLPDGDGPIADIALEPAGDRELLTVRTAAGKTYAGEMTASGRIAGGFRLLEPQPGSEFTGDPGDILDVQRTRGGLWLFLMRDRLKRFDPRTREWLADELLPVQGTNLKLHRVFNRYILTQDGSRVWHAGAQNGEVRAGPFLKFERTPGEQVAIDREGSIWRLAAAGPDAGRVVRCRPGDTVIDRCEAATPPPIPLNPKQVSAAWVFRTWLVLVEAGKLRAIDPSRHVEAKVDPALQGHGDIVDARLKFSKLWLLSNTRGLAEISDLVEKDGWRIHPSVTDIKVDAGGELWARFGGEWRRYGQDGFKAHPLPAGKIAFSSIEDDGQFVAVSDSGQIYRWEQGAYVDGGVLASGVNLADVETILPGRRGSYWVYGKGRLTHLEQRGCPPPAGLCLKVLGSVEVPSRPVRVIDPGGGIARFAAAGNKGYRVITAGYYAVLSDTLKARRPDVAIDDWPKYRSRVSTLPGGKAVYDPPRYLTTTGEAGALIVRRQSGITSLGVVAVNELAQAPALDAGWLSWDRETRTFSVRKPNGRKTMTPGEMFPRGRFLADGIKAMLAREYGIYAANDHGVWRYGSNTFGLDDPDIRFLPAALPGPVVAAHGRFATRERTVRIGEGDGAPAVRPTGSILTTAGRLQFSEDLFQGGLTALYNTDAGPVVPWGAKGFTWDSRRGIALGPKGLLILSDAGVHGLFPERGLAAGPAGAPVPDELRTPLRGGAYVRRGSSWFLHTRAGWKPAENPAASAWTAIETSAWIWSVSPGGLRITDAGGPGSGEGMARGEWTLVENANGTGFARDRLSGAIARDRDLLIVTAGGIEERIGGDAVTAVPVWYPPVPAGRLLVHGGEIYRLHDGIVTRWSTANGKFLPAAAKLNPFDARVLASDPLLRFRIESGKVVSEQKSVVPGAADDWHPFEISADGMPFDVVTDMQWRAPYLYVGTEGGVQAYHRGRGYGLRQANAVYPTGPVARVFEPVEAPGLVVAETAAGCRAYATLTAIPCKVSLMSGRARLAGDAFWSWQRDGPLVTGAYKVASAFPGARDGLSERRRVIMAGGQFEHDRLLDAALCGGVTATLSFRGMVQTGKDAKASLAIGEATRLYDLSAIRPERLLCVADRFRSAGITVEPGLYAVGKNGAGRLAGHVWQAVDEPRRVVALAEQLRDSEGQSYRYGQMRIAVGAGAEAKYEYQDLKGDWHSIPWRNGRLAIDDIARAAIAGGRVWAATDAGFLSYTKGPDGELRLNADAVTLIREPRPDGKACPVTDLINAQGTVVIRCNGRSDAVYTGVLTATKDTGVFTKYTEADPFVKLELVKGDKLPWTWEAVERVQGSPGRLTFSFKGEPNPLANGRFDFDRISSIAVFEAERLEFAGDVGGWFRGYRNGIPLTAIERPENIAGVEPKQVAAVGLMRQAGKPLQLCLSAGSVGGVLLAPDGTTNNVAACFEDQGTDGLWTYAKSGRLLAIESAENPRRQTVTRRMRAGRFGDDEAGGVPFVTGEGEAARYRVPTRAGLLTFDQSLKRIGIAPWTDQAKAADPPPTSYFGQRGSGALFTRDARVFDFVGEGKPATALPAGGAKARVLSVGDGPFSLIKVRWTDGKNRGFFMGRVGDKGLGLSLDNAFPLDVSAFPAIVQRRSRLAGVDLLITVTIEPDKIVLHDRARTREHAISLPHPMALRNYTLSGTTLLLMDEERLVEVNLNKPAWWLLQKTPGTPKPAPKPGGSAKVAPLPTAAATTAAATAGRPAATAAR